MYTSIFGGGDGVIEYIEGKDDRHGWLSLSSKRWLACGFQAFQAFQALPLNACGKLT